jgi:predicted dehydrogenase
MKKYNIGLIGTGLQSHRRLPAIKNNTFCKIAKIAGINRKETEMLCKEYEAQLTLNWQDIIDDKNIDIIVICTPPNLHYEIAYKALKNKKHVLCEKPLTRSSIDAQKLVLIAKEENVVLKCGFNHRHHPAMLAAFDILKKGEIGIPFTGRAVYGICGREGSEKEWRSDTTIVSGGQLMEQGIHCVDLFRWYMGNFESVSANVATKVFPIMPLEDTATILLHAKNNDCATIHSSITQWKNTFHLEVYGTEGYFEIVGLGGSYELQQLRIGKRAPNEPFSEQIIDFRGRDKSWNNEWNHFIDIIRNESTQLLGSGEDGVNAMRIIESAYNSAKIKQRALINE